MLFTVALSNAHRLSPQYHGLCEIAQDRVAAEYVADTLTVQLFGFSLAGSLALYYLNQEREVASGLLIASIDELQQSTGKVIRLPAWCCKSYR